MPQELLKDIHCSYFPPTPEQSGYWEITFRHLIKHKTSSEKIEAFVSEMINDNRLIFYKIEYGEVDPIRGPEASRDCWEKITIIILGGVPQEYSIMDTSKEKIDDLIKYYLFPIPVPVIG